MWLIVKVACVGQCEEPSVLLACNVWVMRCNALLCLAICRSFIYMGFHMLIISGAMCLYRCYDIVYIGILMCEGVCCLTFELCLHHRSSNIVRLMITIFEMKIIKN